MNTGTSIMLTFDVTFDEGFAFGREMARTGYRAWPRRLAGIVSAFMAIRFAVSGDWLIATLLAVMAVHLCAGLLAWYWILRLFFGGLESHFDLEFDARGIRGEHAYATMFGGRTERKPIDHEWNRVRRIERLTSFLLFEFHGGSQAIIPIRAFLSQADLDQCEAWARGGLARQLTGAATVGHAPA